MLIYEVVHHRVMSSEPFFHEPADIKLWSRLDEIESQLSSGKDDKGRSSLRNMIEEISISLNPVHSAILVRILRIAVRERLDDIQSISVKVMEKCSLSDTLPALEAIDIQISTGKLDVARYIIERLSAVADLAFLEYEKGRMKLSEGEHEAAREAFMRTYNIDPSFIKVYDRLIELDGITDEWEIRKNIALLSIGAPTELASRSFPNSNMESLYRIYWEWYKGDAMAAKNMLDVSVGNDGLPDFRLAAARIYKSFGDIETSVRFYRDSVENMPDAQYVKTEFADALMLSGRSDESLIVLNEVERTDPLNRDMMEIKIRALSVLKKNADLKEYCNSFLNTEHADRNGYVFVARMLSECGETSEASKIIDMLISRYQNDPMLYVLRSSNDLAAERFAAALASAEEAVRISSRDPECRYQRARILAEMGRMKKAMRDIDAALSADGRHLPSLILLKDIWMDQKDHERALETCDTILSIDPMNSDVRKDKAYALDVLGRKDESLEEYRDALRIRHNSQLFEEVLMLLVSSERYDELKDLCTEFTESYGNNSMVWRLKGNAEYACQEYQEAFESFSKAADIAPYEPQIWHSRGMAAEKAGLLKKAEESYDKALLLDLDNSEYWLSRAVIQERRGNLKGAVISLNRVISESPDSVFALVRKAMILVKLERYEEAIFFVDLALKINSKDVTVHEMKKDILKHTSRYEQLIRASDDMLLVDPRNEDALHDKTEAQIALGQYTEALETVNTALTVSVTDELLMMKKSAAKGAGDHKATEEACRQMLLNDPRNREIRMDLADALAASGDSEAAIMIYDQLHAEDPLDVKVTVMKAKVRSDIGDDSEAVELFQEVLENRPDDPDTLNVLANVMLEQGYSDEAVRVLDRAISLDPKDLDSRKMKARILIDDRKADDAYDSLREALRIKPNDAEVWCMMGEVQENKGDMHQALLSYDSAMKMGMDNAELYAIRGRVQEALGMDEAAINSYSLASLKDPKDVQSLISVSSIQIRLERYSAAAQNLETALKKDPDSSGAMYNRARVHMLLGEEDDAKRLYSEFRDKRIDDPEISMRFRELVGDDSVITDIPGTFQRTFRDDVEMYSSEILKFCYDTGYAIRDEETLNGTEVPEELIPKIMEYLGGIEEYGEIDITSRAFERMEHLSKNMILSERISKIDSEPLVSLSSAYMASGARNIDEAKKLIAYVYKVMTEDIEQDVYPDDVIRMAEEASSFTGDVTVYNIMDAFDIGICYAKMAKVLSAKMSGSITFHV